MTPRVIDKFQAIVELAMQILILIEGDMDAQETFVSIALFVCVPVAVKALLEAAIGLRLLQVGQSATYIRALIGADGESARHGS